MPTSRKTTTSMTAEFLARAIEFSGLSQRAIAEKAGFPKPNVISMMKRGDMPVPIDRIAGLAEACHVDAVYFLRLALEEYTPTAYAALVNTLGMPLTANEHEMVLLYRLASEDEEIEINTDVARAVIDALLGFKTGADDGALRLRPPGATRGRSQYAHPRTILSESAGGAGCDAATLRAAPRWPKRRACGRRPQAGMAAAGSDPECRTKIPELR